MLRKYRADLHIHTCLSPCGAAEMVAPRIVEAAVRVGLDLIAICDHNAAENVVAVQEAARQTPLVVMGGIEITTREEVHILALFDSNNDLNGMQNVIYKNLNGTNSKEAFGRQFVTDSEGYITGENGHLLIGATVLSLGDVVKNIHDFNGLALAAHVDRCSFGLIGQLGFIPETPSFDALGISSVCTAVDQFDTGHYPLVTFSDAHCLNDIGNLFTEFKIAELSARELKKGLWHKDGRSFTAYPGYC